MATALAKSKSKQAQRKRSVSSGATPASHNTANYSSGARLGAFYAAGPTLSLGASIQAKVAIGAANDRYEKEANTVADQVINGKSASVVSRLPAGGLGTTQRQENDDEAVQMQGQDEGEAVQTQAEEETAQTLSLQRQDEDEKAVQTQNEGEEPVQTYRIQRQTEEGEETVQTQAEEETAQTLSLQRQEEGKEAVQTQSEEETAQTLSLQRQDQGEEPAQTYRIQRQTEENEETVQPQAEEEAAQTLGLQRQDEDKESVQTQAEEETAQTLSLQRQDEGEEPVQTYRIQRQTEENEETVQTQAEEETAQTLSLQREEDNKESAQPLSIHDRGQADHSSGMMQRQTQGEHTVSPAPENLENRLQQAKGGGSPLDAETRINMEESFGAGFSGVRVHTDSEAASLSQNLGARAFTYGNDIFFNEGEYQPNSKEGQYLLAHELTHTIQQGTATQRDDGVSVTQKASLRVQRLGISDALDYFADKAYLIPGFRMFTIILGINPINMSHVERSAANILRALIEFIPGGALITQALDNYGIFDRVGTWVEEQIRTLGMTGSLIRQAVNEFLDSLSWSDIFDLGDVWRRGKRIFTEPIDRIISFAGGLVSGIIQFIKDAILSPLASLAEGTPGWDLLRAVLGYDPISGDPFPRNAETLIGGFMKLIGQEEVWNDIKRANAVERAWAWFQGALSGLLAFVMQIPTRFMQVLQELELADIVLLPRAFARIGIAFAGFVGEFISWAGQQVMSLLQIIFEVVAPAVMPYIRRAAGAFQTIIRDPIGFVGNLVRAGILGLRQFSRHFLTHLRASLIGWLTGAMSGANIYIPQAFNLQEILKFVLSVLGLTWQNIRQKLVRAIGEPAVSALETGFELVKTLVTEGPAAAWEQILEGISNLREMVMEQIMTFVRDRIVQAAITKLVTSLNPAGAFIQAIIATYNTIMFFVERLRQIAQVAAAFIDSISAIASGVIGAAANRVEQTMAGMLTLVISFLARIAGLGRVSDAVTEIIDRVREPIDKALDRVVAWIVRQARRVGRFIAQAGVPQDPNERLRLGMRAALGIARRITGRITRALLTQALTVVKTRYGFQTLSVLSRNGTLWIRGQINPEEEEDTGKTEVDEIAQAKKAFGMKPFTTQSLANLLGIALRTARLRTLQWRDQGELYAMRTEQSYTFDASKVAIPPPAPGEHPSNDPGLDRQTWKIKSSVKIRDTYYKKNFRQANLNTVLTGADSGRTNAQGEKLYECAGGWGPNHIPFPTISELEIDHTTDVSTHWNDEGRKTTQKNRNDWYDDPDHLAVLCHSCNESKAKGRYLPDVEIGFRGPNED